MCAPCLPDLQIQWHKKRSLFWCRGMQWTWLLSLRGRLSAGDTFVAFCFSSDKAKFPPQPHYRTVLDHPEKSLSVTRAAGWRMPCNHVKSRIQDEQTSKTLATPKVSVWGGHCSLEVVAVQRIWICTLQQLILMHEKRACQRCHQP